MNLHGYMNDKKTVLIENVIGRRKPHTNRWKQLRKMARESGAVETTGYVQVPRTNVPAPHNGSIFVTPYCQRGVYRALKKQYQGGNNGKM